MQWIGTGGFGSQVQDLSYTFDMLGNLIEREQNTLGLNQSEVFGYDGLNRLKTVRLSSTDLGVSNQLTLSMNYDASGNITSKTGVGSYQYLNGRPHAVSRAGSTNYNYDLNGNVTSDSSGRTFTYTAFERLSRASKGANWSQYYYAPDLNWVKRQTQGTDAVNASSETVWRIGNVEIVEKSGVRELKRTVGGEVQISHWSNGNVRERYLHKDHLGSIDSISNVNGFVTERMSFGAFGERRLSRDWRFGMGMFELAALREITAKGFTGHEMADAVGIIHMGGRIYDPKLGRFLQADPFMQAPDNSQNLNRYTYVLNNPLSFIDPSGFFFGKLFKFLRIGAAIGLTVFTGGVGAGTFTVFGISGGLAGLGIAAAGGFISGALLSGNIQGALIGAFSAFVFSGLGQQIGLVSSGLGSGFLGSGLNAGQFLGATAAGGLFGGMLSKIQGGKFGHAFISAGVANLLGPTLGRIKNDIVRTAANAVLGGTVSELTGGKFVNGAATAAFTQLLTRIQARAFGQTESSSSGGNSLTADERRDIYEQAKAELIEKGLLSPDQAISFDNRFAVTLVGATGDIAGGLPDFSGTRFFETLDEATNFILETEARDALLNGVTTDNSITIFASAVLPGPKRFGVPIFESFDFTSNGRTVFTIFHELQHVNIGRGGTSNEALANKRAIRLLRENGFCNNENNC